MPKEIAISQSHPRDVALLGDQVFWSSQGTGAQFGRVSRAPKAGGTLDDVAVNGCGGGRVRVRDRPVEWWPGAGRAKAMRERAVQVRLSRVEEAEALGALCVRSKAHWGYDEAFMRLAAPALSVQPEAIREGRVFVAVDADDRPRGVARLDIESPEVAELGLLFVDVPAMGTGVGAALFRHVAAEARRRGCRRMGILSDPYAAPFYERMGARFVRQAPSDAIEGRTLPYYELDLAASA
jgi:GNAT superfamily N-acetyltransferase